jgi:hypothetical protein
MSHPTGSGSRLRFACLLALLACVVAPEVAVARDPGRWYLTWHSPIPFEYYQGITSDPAKALYFDGVFVGLYRTTATLAEKARTLNVIPAEVTSREGYNHIGDLTWDAAEGGRLLLPLECYLPGAPNGPNTCKTASIGVADPVTLRWRLAARPVRGAGRDHHPGSLEHLFGERGGAVALGHRRPDVDRRLRGLDLDPDLPKG